MESKTIMSKTSKILKIGAGFVMVHALNPRLQDAGVGGSC